jgi:hypothetical protein
MIDCHLVFVLRMFLCPILRTFMEENEKTRYEIPFIATAAKYDTMFRVFVL